MKRVFDLLVVLATAIVWVPLLLLVAVVVRLAFGRPVFFVQQRGGFGGQPFGLVKFRTMHDARTPSGALLPDSQRLSPVGAFLRSSSLDEVPELWNVIKGDMSLVGPRPLLVEYLPLYSPEQARRHEVLPGVTGWAQINGRNALSWDEKFRLDVWYVDHRSMRLDLSILARTALLVLRREGVSAAGEATMPRFVGSKGLD
jgi:sugar transferase EpsL